jgi:hypothetical protein
MAPAKTDTPAQLKQAIRLVANPSAALPKSFDNTQRAHYDRLRAALSDDNVVGVGISEKTVAGRGVGTTALTFYVREKRPSSALRGSPEIPPVIAAPKGRAFFSDVFVVGEMQLQSNVARAPIRSGFSVAHRTAGPGTLGALVQRNHRAMILSAAHVLARSGLAQRGDGILFPAGPDGGTYPNDLAATLFESVPLQPGGDMVNGADAALAEIVPPRIADLDAIIPVAKYPIRIVDPNVGMQVVLTGRTSGQARSVVRDVNFHFQLPDPDIGRVGFANQVRCDPYTEAGDSGALVLDAKTGAVVGLHFSGSNTASAFTPIRRVIQLLRFQF